MSKRLNRLLAITLTATLAGSGLVACNSKNTESENGQVYFLNWKPEQEQAFKDIAAEYTTKTGIPVKVATAASGTYEQTLKAQISKSDAPTLIQVNGPVGLQTWQKYTENLTDSKIAKALKDPGLALKGSDGNVYGVPMAVEGYGIIYNQAILDKYFAMDGAKASSVADINNFETLKAVTEDMQSKKEQLGIDGVFAATSLASGEDWRWQTHLSDVPFYYEFKDDDNFDPATVTFKYNEQFKNTFDLYLNNSTVPKTLTPSKDVAASMAEFAQGKAAMVQNGNWAWSQIADIEGNVVKSDDIKFMPIYTGHKGEENQGLNIGTEAFMAINAKASEKDKKATQDFIDWLFLSDEGKKHVVNELGFIAPFDNYTKDDIPADPLAQQISQSMENKSHYVVPWVFTVYPGQSFKNSFGQALAQYAAGNSSWDDVVTTVVDSWAADKKK